MKTKMMRLLLAALMMGLPMFQSDMYADSIHVQTNKTGDSIKEHYPHLAPRHYSHLVSAVWDDETGILTLLFNTGADEACISVYKDDTLVIEETRPVFEGEVMLLDLSSYGAGDYQVVITGMGDDVLYGSF